ncbi:radical SAM/SPASM domain-containing protein [Clostridium chromiireducens]|uniref:radical SAM/SPASM domain-containing protein n=1 Tax=Clostridium chromiireducens TaxID=225345 RepID=UPI0013655772|nr:radical SAM protein [Clostridium chromiireducens]
MKDLVKLTQLRDEKEMEKVREQTQFLQAEKKYPKEFNFPLTMQFELTANCNLRCKHCYNASGIKNFDDAMTIDKWIGFSKYVVSNGGIFQCVISGGEPLLLGDDLFRIMDILHADGTAFLLITNGFLLTKEIAKKLSKYRYMWLQVSIDGYNAESHDSFRNIEGSWERAVKGAFEISKNGIPLTIAHTTTPETLNDIDKMCDLAYELGASTIIIGEVTPSGRSMENKNILLNYEQKQIMLEKIQSNTERYSGRMTVNRSSSTKIQLQKYQSTPNSGVIIRPNGDIRMDCMTPFIIGNVLEEDFCEVWKKKGSNCWHDSRISEYIEGVDPIYGLNSSYKNYVDKDIKL